MVSGCGWSSTDIYDTHGLGDFRGNIDDVDSGMPDSNLLSVKINVKGCPVLFYLTNETCNIKTEST